MTDHAGGRFTTKTGYSQMDGMKSCVKDRFRMVRSGRMPEDVLFPITDARKTLKWINAKAKTNVQGHGLRDTFASIAEELVSGGLLKRMLNHSVAGDVTLGHYVGKSEAQLRAGWQTVADFIEAAALLPTPDDVKVVAGAAFGSDPVGTSAHTGLAK